MIRPLKRVESHTLPSSIIRPESIGAFTSGNPRLGQSGKVKTFDPWPVFFRREYNRNWPFLVGFSVTGFLITKHAMSLTEEDAKKSKFTALAMIAGVCFPEQTKEYLQ